MIKHTINLILITIITVTIVLPLMAYIAFVEWLEDGTRPEAI